MLRLRSVKAMQLKVVSAKIAQEEATGAEFGTQGENAS
jgi:hypothetical protein